MKAMKIALLGTAALAAASVSARADSTSDLKAQIEALNARVATLETTPAMPAGYQMVSFSKDEDGRHVITIMPTADAPAAAATVVSWSGYVKTAIGAVGAGNGAVLFTPAVGAGPNSAVDILTKAGFNVTGKTDTAVGEVGASISVQSSAQTYTSGLAAGNGGNGAISTDGFSGWWKMTPNLTVTGGILGTLSNSSYSWDAVASTYFFAKTGGAVESKIQGTGDPAALKLSYADGPLSFAIQVEDSNNTAGNASAFGGSAKIGYSMDMLSMDVGGGVWGNAAGGTAWAVSTGIKGSFSGIDVGVAAGTGADAAGVASTLGSAWAIAKLSDSVSLELGAKHEFAGSFNQTDFGAGIYYSPVKQLVVGLEGGYTSTAAPTGNGSYGVGLITAFKF